MFVSDVKGDLSGLAAAGEAGGAAEKRAGELGVPFAPTGFPVEFLSLGGIGPGVPVRATVSDFGPQLLAKVLGANETQEQSLSLVFHYADEKGLPLLDLSDLRALLAFLDSDAGKPELAGIGGLSSATVGVLLRSLVGLEDGGGNEFFGEPMLDVKDLMRTADDGRGVISCLELPGRPGQAEAVLDRADVAAGSSCSRSCPRPVTWTSRSWRSSSTRRTCCSTRPPRRSWTRSRRRSGLIRSKGVGVYFVTQTPKDVPGEILGQLGNRVQHALRAFTPEDCQGAQGDGLDVPQVRVLRPRDAAHRDGDRRGGGHDPLRERRAYPGRGHADDSATAVADGPGRRASRRRAEASPLWSKYGERVDNQSAREMLAARMEQPAAAESPADARRRRAPRLPRPSRRLSTSRPPTRPAAASPRSRPFLQSKQGKQLSNQVMRGVFGLLKKKI